MELIKVKKLRKVFPKHGVTAVDDVDFSVSKGEILGLVGESGCGKSTLAKAMLRLIDIEGGSVFYKGEDLLKVPKKRIFEMRKKLQIIFQDPYTSLDPRVKIGPALEEVFIIHRGASRKNRRMKVIEILEMVGLGESYFNRLPSELSGGERQRIGIARALATDPEFIVCDEPVSSLDISIQAQILNLLMDLRDRKDLTYFFISHDLGVIASICDRVAVMKSGKFIETDIVENIFKNPKHEYTKTLIEAGNYGG